MGSLADFSGFPALALMAVAVLGGAGLKLVNELKKEPFGK